MLTRAGRGSDRKLSPFFLQLITFISAQMFVKGVVSRGIFIFIRDLELKAT